MQLSRVMQEKLSKIRELAAIAGETPASALWGDLFRAGGEDAYYLRDIYRRIQGFRFWETYPTFRDEFVALCDTVGVRTEQRGKKVFMLKPQGVLDYRKRADILARRIPSFWDMPSFEWWQNDSGQAPQQETAA